ncbi:MAG TPA: ATP-binding protein [Ktedonosporobacter sp.]|jgi:PAS domain S-box-containing protein|nr:ATP-binding protein [Ktedonosporobacter sp.]
MEGKKLSPQENYYHKNFGDIVDLITNYAIFTLDVEGHITSWNKGAELIEGWQEAEVLGRHFSLLYPDEQASKGMPEQHLRLARDKGLYGEEAYRKKKNGELFLADITLSPIHSEESHHIGYIGVVRDVTERKLAETRQLDTNILLQQEIERRKKIEADLMLSNEELDTFASAASHDLQEPLRMVVSYLQLIERRYADRLDQDGIEFLHFAVDGASRMKMLINDLVEYSRIGTLGKPFVQTDMMTILQRALSNVAVMINETHAQITYDQLPVLVGEPGELTRLFQNLLANAMKFRRQEPPRIHIGVEEKVREWVFWVEDNGKGIEAKHLRSIFVIFKQLAKRGERAGSGVGLAIAKKIVTRHHGAIWVESTVGKGSTFYFSIPKFIPGQEEVHEQI